MCDTCGMLATVFGTNREWNEAPHPDRPIRMCTLCCHRASLDDSSSPNHAAAVESEEAYRAMREQIDRSAAQIADLEQQLARQREQLLSDHRQQQEALELTHSEVNLNSLLARAGTAEGLDAVKEVRLSVLLQRAAALWQSSPVQDNLDGFAEALARSVDASLEEAGRDPVQAQVVAPRITCYCGHDPVTYTCRRSQRGNVGRTFLRCPRPVGRQCAFFVWCDQIEQVEPGSMQNGANTCVKVNKSSNLNAAGQNSDAAEVNLEFDIVEQGKLTIFCDGQTAGHIDVGEDGMPGVSLYCPTAKATGMESKPDRNEIRAKMLAFVDKNKDDKSESEKISKLASEIKERKKEANSRGTVFLNKKQIVPNAAIARLLLASIKAIRTELIPVIQAAKGCNIDTRASS